MSESLSVLIYLKNMLTDLIYINGIISTELIKITENLAAMRHGEEFLKSSMCIPEHRKLSENIIEIIKKYKFKSQECQDLEKHVLNHNEE